MQRGMTSEFRKGWECSLMVKYLSGIHKVLGSTPEQQPQQKFN